MSAPKEFLLPKQGWLQPPQDPADCRGEESSISLSGSDSRAIDNACIHMLFVVIGAHERTGWTVLVAAKQSSGRCWAGFPLAALPRFVNADHSFQFWFHSSSLVIRFSLDLQQLLPLWSRAPYLCKHCSARAYQSPSVITEIYYTAPQSRHTRTHSVLTTGLMQLCQCTSAQHPLASSVLGLHAPLQGTSVLTQAFPAMPCFLHTCISVGVCRY